MSILHQFRGDQGGFGLQSYNRARAAGINPIHIANAIGSSGMSLGWRARDAIIRDSAAQAFQLKAQRNQARCLGQGRQMRALGAATCDAGGLVG